MSSEKSQNVQDVFLNHVRKNKTPVTVFLVNGVKLQGIITWFDNFCVLLRRDAHSQLVYKHAISTVMPAQPIQLFEGGKEAERVLSNTESAVTSLDAAARSSSIRRRRPLRAAVPRSRSGRSRPASTRRSAWRGPSISTSCAPRSSDWRAPCRRPCSAAATSRRCAQLSQKTRSGSSSSTRR